MRNDRASRRHLPVAPRRFKRALLLTLAAAAACLVSAQTNSNSKVKDFSVPDYYDPPNEKQMKTLLQGAEAEPEADGLIRITAVKLSKFAEDGRLQMLMEAPQCVFDSLRRSVSSPGPLHMRYADGKVSLEGEGFLWQQTNSVLIISNKVRTVIFDRAPAPTSP